jgi:hypothetical protein
LPSRGSGAGGGGKLSRQGTYEGEEDDDAVEESDSENGSETWHLKLKKRRLTYCLFNTKNLQVL